MSSGIFSRCALYSLYISSRNVGSGVSKTTAKCEGFVLPKISNIVLAKTNNVEVFKPFDVIRGLRIIAKCPR